jgi:hypothetical protein
MRAQGIRADALIGRRSRSEMKTARLTSLMKVRLAAIAVYVGLLGMAYRTWPAYETSPDWALWRALPDALASGTLYDTATEAPFVWSPVAAWVMAIVPSMFWPWLILHFVAILFLRDWRMIALVLLSWGFWTSTASGHPFIFIFVAGALALRGSTLAGLAYLALTLLMPRPVQIPLALWLLWTMPTLRWPFVGMFAVHAVVVLLTGYAWDWVGTVVGHALPTGNWGPSAVIGLWGLAIGLPLGIWLGWRGHVGFAGLAVSPYWLPEYLMMSLLDLVPGWKRIPVSDAQPAAAVR